MTVSERIAKLRSLMDEKNIDAYVVPTADFHQSEYVGEHFKARKFITGFSGSYGTAVICKDDAGLWIPRISSIQFGKTDRHYQTNRHSSWKRNIPVKVQHLNWSACVK